MKTLLVPAAHNAGETYHSITSLHSALTGPSQSTFLAASSMPRVILGEFWQRFFAEIPTDKTKGLLHALVDPARACREVRAAIAGCIRDLRAIEPKPIEKFKIKANSVHDWWPKIFVGAVALFAVILRCLQDLVPEHEENAFQESEALDAQYLEKVKVLAVVRIVACPQKKTRQPCPYFSECENLMGMKATTCTSRECKRQRKYT